MLNQVTIIGVGLLGGSLAKDIREFALAKRVIGVCRSDDSAKIALQENIVDAVLPIKEAVQTSDLIVLATPMQAMLPQLSEIAQHIPDDCILTDVGSVKESFYDQVKEQYPALLSQFVFGHPIAGGENSGVTAAKSNLFAKKNIVLTPTPEVNKAYLKTVSKLWQDVGASVVEMDVQQHDAVFARTSHLPHMIAFSLINYLRKQDKSELLFDMAAAGFYDFTRIASSDATMWRDICVSNKQQVLNSIDEFEKELKQLRDIVKRSDQDALHQQFSQAKTARDVGLAKKCK